MKAVSHKKLVLVLYIRITFKQGKITVTYSGVETCGKKERNLYFHSVKNTLNWTKVTIETFTILQTINILK